MEELKVPEFFEQLASKSRIKNVQMSEIQHLFQKDPETMKPVVPVHNYLFCMVASLIKEGKTSRIFTPLKILSCKQEPFIGEHKVFFDGQIKTVETLSSIKISYVKAADQIAFDKCTFLLIPEHKVAIRLCVIRMESFVVLPITGKENEYRKIPPRQISLSINVLSTRVVEYYEQMRKECGYRQAALKMNEFFNYCSDRLRFLENPEDLEKEEEVNTKRKFLEMEERILRLENEVFKFNKQNEESNIEKEDKMEGSCSPGENIQDLLYLSNCLEEEHLKRTTVEEYMA